MRRSASIILFLASLCASVYAFKALSDFIGLPVPGNVREHQVSLLWRLRWVLLALALTCVFAITARGRWRLVATIPLIICAFVAWGIAVVS
jgi:hypothetical protein